MSPIKGCVESKINFLSSWITNCITNIILVVMQNKATRSEQLLLNPVLIDFQ